MLNNLLTQIVIALQCRLTYNQINFSITANTLDKPG